MSFFVYHRYGRSERDPLPESFPALLDELDARPEDKEHTSVSVVHDSEWSLGIFKDGYVVFELADGTSKPRHMSGLSRTKVIALMERLAIGDVATLNQEPWKAGY